MSHVWGRRLLTGGELGARFPPADGRLGPRGAAERPGAGRAWVARARSCPAAARSQHSPKNETVTAERPRGQAGSPASWPLHGRAFRSPVRPPQPVKRGCRRASRRLCAVTGQHTTTLTYRALAVCVPTAPAGAAPPDPFPRGAGGGPEDRSRLPRCTGAAIGRAGSGIPRSYRLHRHHPTP